MTYPQDIIDDANSRAPWKSNDVREWYMEGRMYERENGLVSTESHTEEPTQ